MKKCSLQRQCNYIFAFEETSYILSSLIKYILTIKNGLQSFELSKISVIFGIKLLQEIQESGFFCMNHQSPPCAKTNSKPKKILRPKKENTKPYLLGIDFL